MTNHACIYACIVLQFVQKWYLPALLTIIIYLTRLALLLERYVRRFNGRIVYYEIVGL